MHNITKNPETNKMEQQTKYGALFDDFHFFPSSNSQEDALSDLSLFAMKDKKTVKEIKPKYTSPVVKYPVPNQVSSPFAFQGFKSLTPTAKTSPTKKENSDDTPALQNTCQNLISIELGLTSSHGKVIGGRGNKEPISMQVVALQKDLLPPNYQISQLSVRAHLYGTKKGETTGTEIEFLGQEKKFIEKDGNWKALFDKIVLRHSSHHNGQKLFIRFSLVDTLSKQTLYTVDSSLFETITKRGIEKKRKKNEFFEFPTSYGVVSPNVVPISGGTLVKISGTDFPEIPIQQVVVKFGTHSSSEVVCLKNDLIICETPQITQAKELDISISFDSGVTFISTGLQLNFVSKNKTGIELLMKLFCENSEPLLKKIKL